MTAGIRWQVLAKSKLTKGDHAGIWRRRLTTSLGKAITNLPFVSVSYAAKATPASGHTGNLGSLR